MTVLSDGQIATAAMSAGFAGQDLVTAIAVALAESSGRTDATNNNTNGSTDYGLWQINSVHSDLLSKGNWQSPTDNAAMAKSVHDAAGSWRPWSTYNSGAYLVYYGRAKPASVNPEPLPGTSATGGSTATAINASWTSHIPVIGGAVSSLGSIIKFLQFVANPSNWLRVGEFIAGLALVTFALWQFVGDTKFGETVKSSAETAAMVAAV